MHDGVLTIFFIKVFALIQFPMKSTFIILSEPSIGAIHHSMVYWMNIAFSCFDLMNIVKLLIKDISWLRASEIWNECERWRKIHPLDMTRIRYSPIFFHLVLVATVLYHLHRIQKKMSFKFWIIWIHGNTSNNTRRTEMKAKNESKPSFSSFI